MTTINPSISQISGYNEAQYTELVQTAEARGVDVTTVDAALLSAIGSGKSFTDAVSDISSDLPPLEEPSKRPTAKDYNDCIGLPSFGASAMAIMVENTAEERRDNTELRMKQTQVIAQEMENQADEMRDKASAQLAMGIASGVMSIGASLLTIGMTSKSLAQSSAKYDTFTQGLSDTAAPTTASTVAKGQYDAIIAKQQMVTSGISQLASGATGLIDAGSQYYGTMADARIKEMDADIEKQRAFRDMLQSLDEALAQQISKALSTMEAIQSDMNQTRKRILG